MNLREFVEKVARRISKRFDQRGELWPPIYHIITGDGQDLVVPAFSGDKDVAIFFTRILLEEVAATRYVFASEAWMLDARHDAGKINIDKVNREGVAAQPGRQEVLMFTAAEDEGEAMIMAHREIIRDDAHPHLGPLEFFQYGSNEGRLVGLLPRKKLAS